MDLSQFFLVDDDSDAKIGLALEVVSILQIEFNLKTQLTVKSSRSLTHLIEKFNWNKRPEVTSEATLGSALDFGEVALKIPSHLLSFSYHSPEIQTSQAFSVARFLAEKKAQSPSVEKIITLYLPTDLNEWLSLKEATLSLISFWLKQQDEKTQVKLIEVPNPIDVLTLKKAIVSSQTHVILKISPLTAQVVKLIRTIDPEAPLVLHGFESSSVYFANTFLFGIEDYLSEDDLWIFSCEADKSLAELSWKKIRSLVQPLKFSHKHKSFSNRSTLQHILYFGRISEQKNLHEALFAVSLVSKEMRQGGRKFKIYGQEDYLGVPQLQIPSRGYLDYLKKLCDELDILDLVEFHSLVSREEISQILDEGFFFSASVHSDENFGLVSFQALNQGVPVVLSEWGGHRDLKRYFSGIYYIPVYQTLSGPKTNPFEVARTFLDLWKMKPQVKRHFPEKNYSAEIFRPQEKIVSTDLKLRVNNRVRGLDVWRTRRWPLYGKLFTDYSDPACLKAHEFYGAKKRETPEVFEGVLSPEVLASEEEFKVLDCRTEDLGYPRSKENRNVRLFFFGKEESLSVSSAEFLWLWERGYIYCRSKL